MGVSLPPPCLVRPCCAQSPLSLGATLHCSQRPASPGRWLLGIHQSASHPHVGQRAEQKAWIPGPACRGGPLWKSGCGGRGLLAC